MANRDTRNPGNKKQANSIQSKPVSTPVLSTQNKVRQNATAGVFGLFRTDTSLDLNLDSKEILFKKIFFWSSLALLIIMPLLSFNYGITGDELVHKTNGENVLKYLTSGGKDTTYRHYKNLYLYGGLFDASAAAVYENVGGDPYNVRHFLNALCGASLMIVTGLLAREIAGSWLLALITLLFMLLSPRLFGDSMNNPKDIPFALAYAMSIVGIIRLNRFFPRWDWKSALFLFFAITVAINIRIGGILLLVYFGLYTLVNLFFTRYKQGAPGESSKIKLLLMAAVLGIAGFFAGIIFFPYAHAAPIKNSLAALKEMENFQTAIRMLFEGRALWSDEIPWYYIPKWLMIALPLFILGGLGLFLVKFKTIFTHTRRLPLLFALFVAIFPVAYAIYKHSALYDGIRHFLFIMPVLTVLAALGWIAIGLQFKQSKMKWLLPVLLGILLILPLRFMIANHPNEYVYFNELEGGIKHAHGEYETDYWMNSIKSLSFWIIENDPRIKKGEEVTVVTNSIDPAAYYFKKLAPKVIVRYASFKDRYKYKADYYLSIPRFVDKDLLKNGAWPPSEVVKTVTVDGVPIGAVSRYPDTLMYGIIQANKRRDLMAAAEMAKIVEKRDPKNEVLDVEMANAYLAADSIQKAEYYIERGLAYAPEHSDLLMAKAMVRLRENKFDESYQLLQQCTDLNYRNVSGYYYKALILDAKKDYSTAMEQINKAIEYAPTFKPAYQLAAQILQHAGDNEGAARYLQAIQ